VDNDVMVELACVAVGIAGALFAHHVPASGKGAFVLAFVPGVGVLLAMQFC